MITAQGGTAISPVRTRKTDKFRLVGFSTKSTLAGGEIVFDDEILPAIG